MGAFLFFLGPLFGWDRLLVWLGCGVLVGGWGWFYFTGWGFFMAAPVASHTATVGDVMGL